MVRTELLRRYHNRLRRILRRVVHVPHAEFEASANIFVLRRSLWAFSGPPLFWAIMRTFVVASFLLSSRSTNPIFENNMESLLLSKIQKFLAQDDICNTKEIFETSEGYMIVLNLAFIVIEVALFGTLWWVCWCWVRCWSFVFFLFIIYFMMSVLTLNCCWDRAKIKRR